MSMFTRGRVRSLIEARSVRRQRSRVWVAFAASALIFSAAAPAWAIDETAKSAALQHYKTAKGYYEQHKYLEAAKGFDLALNEVPLPVIALWAARSYQLAGDFDASQVRYREAIRIEPNELWLGDKQQRAQSDATRELDLVLKLAATTQHKPLTEEMDPSVKSGGGGQTSDVSHASQEIDRVLAEGNPWRTVGWVSLCLGGAALTFGTVTGLMLRSRRSELETRCPDGSCFSDRVTREEVLEHNNLRIASSLGFMTGGLLGAAGITLILTTPERTSKLEFAVRITPRGPILEGAF